MFLLVDNCSNYTAVDVKQFVFFELRTLSPKMLLYGLYGMAV